MKINTSREGTSPALRCARIGLLAIAGLAVLGGLVMALWNWLVPPLFVGAQPLGYWQALGLLLLCRILFGRFPGRRCGRRHKARCAPLTPDERERLARRWGCRTGARDETRDDMNDHAAPRA